MPWALLRRQIDPRFRRRARRYFAQCALAGLALFAILALERGLAGAAIVASVASSIFIVFVVPRSVAASTRRVLGGQLVGVATGAAAAGVLSMIGSDLSPLGTLPLALAAAAAVAVAMVFMAVTNTEHPPAAGTCLGLVTQGSGYQPVLFVLSAVLMLVVLRLMLLNRMENLL